MNAADRAYIALCRKLIEEQFRFDTSGGMLRQRDLEYLADNIEEKSGIKLSLSTLKRFWKKDYDQKPHPSTLEALVSVLGYKNWQEFKLKQSLPEVSAVVPTTNRSPLVQLKVVLPVAAALVIIIWLIAFRTKEPGPLKPVIKGPVVFTGNKTVTRGVPNTIIFNYDVSNVDADSFFFQQSWNELEKVKIDRASGVYTNIYYYPGFHKAKLRANDSIIRRFRAHITTDGWMPLLSYPFPENVPVYLRKEQAIRKGALHVTRDQLIDHGVSMDKEQMLSYYNVREFENTHSNHFSVESRIRYDSSNRMACPGFQLVVICEEHIFFVGMKGKGCESNIAVKMGEVVHQGSRNDLSALGTDLHTWQHLQLRVENKCATIYLNKKPVHSITFTKDFGKVVGLVFNFNGTGAIDDVTLKNGENKVVLADTFDK
jgi:hypothetical protein